MIPQTERYREMVLESLKNERQRQLAARVAGVFKFLRSYALQSYEDPVQVMREVAAIRTRSVENMPELLERFEERATAAGAKVYWARNAQEANQIITDIVTAKGIKLAVKGKSMVSEETELNHALEKEGVEVYEGDLGEFIVQQLHQPPFHIVGPAIHLSAEDISDLFVDIMGIKPTSDPVALGRAARVHLRDKFAAAGVGITGVNVAVAETGSICLVENEGNIRLATSKPPVHIALMSIEKVVAEVGDALESIGLLTKSCTGQKISSYISMITGPRKDGETDGPDELHIVILDNGRTAFYQDPELRQALRCIRCGACLGVCPIYTRVGGPTYGWIYSGPMGAVLNPLLLGVNRSQDLFEACTQCGFCQEVCPGGIKHLDMFSRYRQMVIYGFPALNVKKEPKEGTRFMKLFAWGMRSPWRYRVGARLGRAFLKKYTKDGSIKALPILKGWFQYRDLPAPAPYTFREWWASQESQKAPLSTGKEGSVTHGQ
ncbi:MAG: lactate utilization protein B [Syntrophomonadales bacterium]|jgi:L-lactate dehydrogenase complex protein LldF